MFCFALACLLRFKLLSFVAYGLYLSVAGLLDWFVVFAFRCSLALV